MLVPGLRSTRRRPPTLAAALAGLALLGACNSDAAGVTTTSPVQSTTAATPPVATDAPTTTQQANAATALVRQAVMDYWSASRACGQRPKSCKPSSFTATEGTLRTDVQSFVAMLVSSNAHMATVDTAAPGATGTSTDTSYVVVNAITIDPSTSTIATTDECVYDPAPLLGPAGANGTPTVISSAAVPHRFVHTFYLEGGVWLPGGEDVDTSSSACDATADTVRVEYTTPGS